MDEGDIDVDVNKESSEPEKADNFQVMSYCYFKVMLGGLVVCMFCSRIASRVRETLFWMPEVQPSS